MALLWIVCASIWYDSAAAVQDLSCRDASSAWACLLLNNSDGEDCCWCAAVSRCVVHSSSSVCPDGSAPTCGHSETSVDPCSGNTTCGGCVASPGCGWCTASGACGSGTRDSPFSFAQPCTDPSNNWWVGTCPPDNEFYGVPLPNWFSLFFAIVILLTALAMTLFGYRLLRTFIVIVGIGSSGIPAFLFTWSYAPDDGTFSLSTAVLAACVAASIGGFLCWRLFKVGVAILGGSLGVILALLLHLLVFARFLSAYGNTPLIVAAVFLGLGVGALGLRFLRKTMVVATSTLGAYGTMRGVSLFVPGSFLAELTLAKRIQDGQQLPDSMDGYLGGVAAMAIVGVLVQILVTAKKAKKDDKDDLEKELEESDVSLEALQGECVYGRGNGEHSRKSGVLFFFSSLTHSSLTPTARTHQGRKRRRRARARARKRAGAGKPFFKSTV